MKALIPLDGSGLSQSVLPNVQKLAGLIPGFHAVLLSVMNPKSIHGQADGANPEITPAIPGGGRPMQSTLAPEPRIVESHGEALARVHIEALDQLKTVAAQLLPGLAVSCDVVFNEDPAQGIITAARDAGCDMIIMATHGRGGLTQLLTGSVADAVIRHGGIPVLITGPQA